MRPAAALALLPLLALAADPAKPPAEAPAAPAERAAPPAPAPGAPAPAMPHPAPPAPAKEPADVPKALYAVGLAVANDLEAFALSPAELDTVLKGIRDGLAGKPKFAFDQKVQASVNELYRARVPKAVQKAAAREKQQGPPYLAKMAKEKGAVKTPSGAILIPQKEGTGPSPTASDKVKVNYTVALISGRVFETTVNRGPVEIPLTQTVPCWAETFPMLKVGGRARIVCPPELAYGTSGKGGVPGNAVLTFDVELVDVVK